MNFLEDLKTGLKIILGGIGIVTIAVGVARLFKGSTPGTVEKTETKKTMVDPETGEAMEVVVSGNGESPKFNASSGLGEVGSKIFGLAMCAQTLISGFVNIMNAIGSVKYNLEKVLDRSYYNNMLNDPRAAQGYFGNNMIPSNGCYGGYPNGTPVYEEGATYVRRGQVIECY